LAAVLAALAASLAALAACVLSCCTGAQEDTLGCVRALLQGHFLQLAPLRVKRRCAVAIRRAWCAVPSELRATKRPARPGACSKHGLSVTL
jgi:hypothetical protein